jgi:HEAT repeat protein
LLRELAEIGVVVVMVNLLSSRTTAENPQSMPILMKHLRRDYSEGTLASLARSLATKEAGKYWDELVSMYRNSADRTPTGPGNFVMALAAAVSAACPTSRINDLIELLRDRRLPERLLLLTPLKRRRGRDPAIAQVIEELRHDPELSKEIGSWKILKSQAVPRSH